MTITNGKLLHIHTAPKASFEMQETEQADLVAGRGIVGDRYFEETGTYSYAKGPARQITLIEMEALEMIAVNQPPMQEEDLLITPKEHRRNLTTRGVALGHLLNRRFKVGETVLFGVEINAPCKYLQALLERPVYLPLYNRSGLNCSVEVGGTIRKGDTITLL